jgi:hypothetical protein
VDLPKILQNVDGDGLTVIHGDDGITRVYLHDMNRPSVDSFMTFMAEHDQFCAKANKHALRVIRSKVLYPTPYFVTRMIKNSDLTPKTLRESDAVIIPDTRMAFIVRNMILRLNNPAQVSIRLCVNDVEAMAWLTARRQLLGE